MRCTNCGKKLDENTSQGYFCNVKCKEAYYEWLHNLCEDYKL
jgi:hypothetical protein